MKDAETVIHAGWVIPVEPAGACLAAHSVVIDAGRIAAVVPTARARADWRAARVFELPGSVLIPGLVNAHTHAAMSLFRGLADDLPLMEWLNGHIWPAEAKWVDGEFVRDGTRLACAEMIRGGTTFFADMYFHPAQSAAVVEEAGMRACLGMIMLDFPTPYARSVAEYLDKGLALHDEVRHSARVRTAFAPHAPYTVSDTALEKIRVLADELDVPVHMHVHETAHEIDESMARYGMRPLERLDRLDLLGRRLAAVHMTQLLPEEIRVVAERTANVVHCPESNLKLASGFCPVQALHAAGVNVAIGTDGAASNNDLDMLGEMRTAALLAKGVAADPTALPAHTALACATINGARAWGQESEFGSLVPGKSADVVAVDLGALSSQPVFDPVSQLVYTAGRDQVTHVWVAGRNLLEDGRLVTLDPAAILARAADWRARIAG